MSQYPRISPVVSQHSLTWDGFPLFHVDAVSPDFSGKLFFVLGQGLGDHVNGFRVLQELHLRFPASRLIVYADRRWEELVKRFDGVEIRWFPKAMEVRSKEGTNDPYVLAHSEIRKEMSVFPEHSFIAYDHFPMADRHARGEATISATMRSIGLSPGATVRPFLPILETDLIWADSFLKMHELKSGQFAVVAPFTWPNKRWPKECFSQIIDQIYERFGLRSIIIAYPEMGSFENKGSFCAYDLTLGQIAGLLSRAGIYLGLDSGLSHMAAALDLPSIEIFIEKKVIPFEVRSCSPFFLYVIEGFFLEQTLPATEVVFSSISFAWEKRDNLADAIPVCPACLRKSQYVTSASQTDIDFMCVCGTTLKRRTKNKGVSTLNVQAVCGNAPFSASTNNIPMLIETGKDLVTSDDLLSCERLLEERLVPMIRVVLDVPAPSHSAIDHSPLSEKIMWSLDGILFWMERMGYRSISFTKSFHQQSGSSVAIDLVSVVSQGTPVLESLIIPWGAVSLKVRSMEQYLKFYSFEKWGRPPDLVGIVKSMISLGYKKDAVTAAWVAFRAQPVFRSFRWLLKSWWALWLKPTDRRL
jgi:hypothetical protein